MSTIETELLSVGDVAARLKCAPSTLRFWERRGEIPSARRVGITGVRVWGPDDVALIERRVTEGRADRARLSNAA